LNKEQDVAIVYSLEVVDIAGNRLEVKKRLLERQVSKKKGLELLEEKGTGWIEDF
jgi:hypothetical protein